MHRLFCDQICLERYSSGNMLRIYFGWIGGDHRMRTDSRAEKRPKCGIDGKDEAPVFETDQFLNVPVQRGPCRNNDKGHTHEATEQPAGIGSVLIFEIADRVFEIFRAVL